MNINLYPQRGSSTKLLNSYQASVGKGDEKEGDKNDSLNKKNYSTKDQNMRRTYIQTSGNYEDSNTGKILGKTAKHVVLPKT